MTATDEAGMLAAMTAELRAMQQRQMETDAALTQLNVALQQSMAEKNALIKLAQRISDPDIVDIKGVGQPFKYTGKKDHDFSEWSHKFRTFIAAKFGNKLDRALKWAVRQRKTIVADDDGLNKARFVGYEVEFGDMGEDADFIPDHHRVFGHLYAYLISFTSGDANKVVRNAGEGQGLEAWRRLNNEYDPTSSMRRVTILGHVQNPAKCDKIEDLGQALEDWLTRKRQYEEFTDRAGNPCRVSEDSLMAAMYKLMPKSLEETVMFKSEDYDSFETLFDKLVSYASTKHSLKLSASVDKPSKDPNAMDVGSVDKNVQCWVCWGRGHMGKDCPQNKGKGKGKSEKGGKNKGKGGSGNGGNFGGCYTCGGPHYASECPKGKGKGGGKKGGKKGKGQGNGKASWSNGKGTKNQHPINSVDENGWAWVPDEWWGWLSEGGSWQQTAPAAAAAPQQQQPQQQQQQQQQSWATAPTGSLDLGSVDADISYYGQVENSPPGYVVEHDGEKWIRFNYDSGAALTALPVALAEGLPLDKVGEFITASGDAIPNYGRVKFDAMDEDANVRAVRGSVSQVHKPLCAAGEMSRTQDAILWEEGGFLLPRDGPVAKKIRKELYRLLRKHGRQGGVLPLYREGNLYNFYLKKKGPAELAPVTPAAQPQGFQRQGEP